MSVVAFQITGKKGRSSEWKRNITECRFRPFVKCRWISFLARPVMNIACNIIDILWVRYHYARDRVTMVWPLWRDQQSMWHHQQKANWASETRGRCAESVLSEVFDYIFWNKIMHAHSRRTIYVLTGVLFDVYFPPCCATRNKHQSNPPVSA